MVVKVYRVLWIFRKIQTFGFSRLKKTWGPAKRKDFEFGSFVCFLRLNWLDTVQNGKKERSREGDGEREGERERVRKRGSYRWKARQNRLQVRHGQTDLRTEVFYRKRLVNYVNFCPLAPCHGFRTVVVVAEDGLVECLKYHRMESINNDCTRASLLPHDLR